MSSRTASITGARSRTGRARAARPASDGRHVLSRAVALAVVVVVGLTGCAGAGSAAGSDVTSRQARNEQLIRDAFDREVGAPDTFYGILADDVEWTIAGSTPRTYNGREQFFAEGSSPIVNRLSTQIRPTVRDLYAEGDVVVAWWDGVATARDGQPYTNSYAWIMTLRDDRVVRVVAFVDFTPINDLIERVPA